MVKKPKKPKPLPKGARHRTLREIAAEAGRIAKEIDGVVSDLVDDLEKSMGSQRGDHDEE